jgi:2-desacetyl-2-hydroxyethyl bacteriochlorophyllide A dehydrogenase
VRRQAVVFTAPGEVAVVSEPVQRPAAGEVLAAVEVSAISAGSELLVLLGGVAEDTPLDATIPTLAGPARFPLRYGYAAVGTVQEIGDGVERSWLGRRVLAFHPHASCLVAPVASVVPLPDDLPAEAAALLPTVETAVTLLMDGRPEIGERVVVCGQGVVGLATTALLAGLPLSRLVTLDRHPLRRAASLELGAGASLDPAAADTPARLTELLAGSGDSAGGGEPAGADLVFELSGSGEGLDHALSLAGFGGRVVLGSWYGREAVAVHLGGAFHRSRIELVASQVSTLAPRLGGRWTKARRLATAIAALRRLPAGRLVSHHFPVARAAEAYALLAERHGEALQVLLTYEDSSCTP